MLLPPPNTVQHYNTFFTKRILHPFSRLSSGLFEAHQKTVFIMVVATVNKSILLLHWWASSATTLFVTC